jgi:hypothetical protein
MNTLDFLLPTADSPPFHVSAWSKLMSATADPAWSGRLKVGEVKRSPFWSKTIRLGPNRFAVMKGPSGEVWEVYEVRGDEIELTTEKGQSGKGRDSFRRQEGLVWLHATEPNGAEWVNRITDHFYESAEAEPETTHLPTRVAVWGRFDLARDDHGAELASRCGINGREVIESLSRLALSAGRRYGDVKILLRQEFWGGPEDDFENREDYLYAYVPQRPRTPPELAALRGLGRVGWQMSHKGELWRRSIADAVVLEDEPATLAPHHALAPA